jgi:4-hydroxybenzoate polyprenyltransferase
LELDKIERPERAIPSGRIRLQNAFIFGTMLLLIGIISAFLNNSLSGIIASLVAILALVYDKYGKHHSFLGPMNMGLCRGGNLILGMSIVASTVSEWWWLGILPVCYIAAITMISRGEVHGGKKNTLYFAAFLYAFVNISQLTIAYRLDTLWFSLAFVSLHIFLISIIPFRISFKSLIDKVSIFNINLGSFSLFLHKIFSHLFSLNFMNVIFVKLKGGCFRQNSFTVYLTRNLLLLIWLLNWSILLRLLLNLL